MANEFNTVVEFTKTHLKLVQSRDSQDGIALTEIIFKELTSDSPADAAQALKEAWAEIKSRPKTITCVLPRNETTVRVLRLPSQDGSEIKEMIGLQLARLTPYPAEDIVFDYMPVGTDDEGSAQVVLVIAHKEAVDRYVNIFKTANLNLSRLVLSSQGICNLYLYYQNKLGPSLEKETIAILDIDKEDTEICFYYKGNLVFSRALQLGNEAVKEGRVDSLIGELRLTLDAYAKEGVGVPVKKMVLTNMADSPEVLSQKIESALSMPIEIINPQTELFKDKNVVVPLSWAQGQVSANALLGWAVQNPEKALNLLPAKILSEHREKTRNREVVVLFILYLAVIFLLPAALAIKVYKKNQYYKKLTNLVEETDSRAGEARRELKKMELIKDNLPAAGSLVEIISQLYDMLPPGVVLRSIDIDNNGNITLEGDCVDMADVFNLQGNLEKAVQFNNAKVKFARKTKRGTKEITEFNLICQIEKGRR